MLTRLAAASWHDARLCECAHLPLLWLTPGSRLLRGKTGMSCGAPPRMRPRDRRSAPRLGLYRYLLWEGFI